MKWVSYKKMYINATNPPSICTYIFKLTIEGGFNLTYLAGF